LSEMLSPKLRLSLPTPWWCLASPPRASALTAVITITKCWIWGAAREPVHGDGESATPVWPHQRLDGPRWLERRKSMGSSDEVRELPDDEIDGVNGGLVVIAIIAVLIGLLVPAVQ
jgi:hypothetical protein